MGKKAVSLFASSGIGDLAVRAAGLEVIVANELVKDRVELFKVNFPETKMLEGDIWALADEIVATSRALLAGEELDLLLATPPCQGMSKNGMGKILAEVRAGNRPAMDPRNRLIIPTLDIAVALRPRIILFENVPEMANTLIQDESGDLVNIIDYIQIRLGSDYIGKAEVVEFADHGVPQRRQRLITVFSRDDKLKEHFYGTGSFIAPGSHASLTRTGRKKWLSLKSVIADFPPLAACEGENAKSEFHPLHRVPILDEKKLNWIRNTPEGKSAFDNQCVNPKCKHQGNGLHGSEKTQSGVNRSKSDTPLFCEKCGELLPRPYTIINGSKRLMKGFTSAYKRMSWDAPAPTLTTNLSYPSSDQKIHPDQDRVLSLYEALTIHTITDYSYKWLSGDGRPVADGVIRDSIGESVPPRGLERLIRYLYES